MIKYVPYCETHDTSSPTHQEATPNDPCRWVGSSDLLNIMHHYAAKAMHDNNGGCSLRHALNVAIREAGL